MLLSIVLIVDNVYNQNDDLFHDDVSMMMNDLE